MRILFINPRAYLPQLLGGVETTTFDLCRQLDSMGHASAVMSSINKYDLIWLRNRIMSRLARRVFPVENFRGARVYRGYQHEQGLTEVIADFRPEVLVIAGGSPAAFDLAPLCAASGVRTFFYFHELVQVLKLPNFDCLRDVELLANSEYTTQRLRALLQRDSVPLPPLVDHDAYRTQSTREFVTMVNPRQIKGGDIALALARACPDIPFLFVEAWHTKDSFVAGLRRDARALPNVTWRAPTQDMLSIFRRTRILLVPSRWEETWGRVITEAHASGIPAIATDYAALPESVGPGGVLVARDATLADWQSALRGVWDDASRYEELSARALAYSRRPEAQPAQRAADLIAALR
ncbi:MAG: glycosyltransferase [Gammaproteobacteria bacterium]|nr:glycosyltransferase [Gammaproteobacteria bacterium]